MSGGASTCRALTAAFAPKDTHLKETDDTARVSADMPVSFYFVKLSSWFSSASLNL